MRNLMILGLCACMTATAAAQTEVIIRRPGEKDQVIRLDDSTQMVALRSKLGAEIGTLRRQMANDRGLTKLMIDTLSAKDITIRSRELASEVRAKVSAMTNAVAAMQQPHLGVWVDTRPRDSDKYGAYVQLVTPGSPAARAGIVAGDVITRIAGKSLTDVKSDNPEQSGPGMRLIAIVSTLETGKTVEVQLRRGNDTKTVKVTPVEDNTMALATPAPGSPLLFGDVPLEARGEAVPLPSRAFGNLQMFAQNGPGGSFYYSFGTNNIFADYELAPMNEKLGSYFGTSEGVLVVNVMEPTRVVGRMTRDSTMPRVAIADTGRGVAVFGGRELPTAQLGLEPGDVIVSIDGRKVSSPSQLMRIVATYDRGESFKLQYMRQKRAESVDVKMP